MMEKAWHLKRKELGFKGSWNKRNRLIEDLDTFLKLHKTPAGSGRDSPSDREKGYP